MNISIIQLLKDSINFKQKDLIIEFLEKENTFLEIIKKNDKEKILSDDFIDLGRELNFLSTEIKYNKEEFDNLREYLSYLGIQTILVLKTIPDNYHVHIVSQEFSGIGGKSLAKIYSTLYNKYLIINKVYSTNGDYGLIRYIAINKKMLSMRDKTLADLCMLKLLSISDILEFTSNKSHINKYTSSEIAKNIYKIKLKDRNKSINQENDVINL